MSKLPIDVDGGISQPDEEWVGMPEFVQNDKKEYALIRVRIKNENDFNEFKKLIGEPYIGPEASIWYPKQKRGLDIIDKRWVDEADAS